MADGAEPLHAERADDNLGSTYPQPPTSLLHCVENHIRSIFGFHFYPSYDRLIYLANNTYKSGKELQTYRAHFLRC